MLHVQPLSSLSSRSRLTLKAAVFLALVMWNSVNVAPVSARTFCPPTALVLSFDASGSISGQEYALQTKGTALALLDQSVLNLIAAQGGISVSALIWSDTSSGIYIVPWQTIVDQQTMANFAQKIVSAPRIPSGNTDIGNGLWHSLDLLEEMTNCASRRIINVSGDGRETAHARGRTTITLATARERAEIEGVVINGLAITSEDEDLAVYFTDRVKTGPGSFVMEVRDYSDFQSAMTKKLFREISEPVIGKTETLERKGVRFSALPEWPRGNAETDCAPGVFEFQGRHDLLHGT